MSVNWTAVGVLFAILAGWSGLLFGGLKWFLNREVSSMDRRFTKLDDHLEKNQAEHESNRMEHAALDQRIHTLRADLGESYVKREDWLRLEVMLDRKFTEIYQKVDVSVRGVHQRLDKILMGGKDDG